MLNNFSVRFVTKTLSVVLLLLSSPVMSEALAADNVPPTERERINAERGDVTAQVDLGIAYYNNKNYEESIKWFTKAADNGNAVAQYNLGNMYIDGTSGLKQDYAEALKWYKKSAEQGYGFAQNNLGVAYKNGQGVPKDYIESIKWFTKAAEQNVAVAQNNLGVIYQKGTETVPQDHARAIEWYKKAAENNDANGQFNLGSMYANGEGVKKDAVQAYLWISLAAEQNKKYAIERLASLQEVMTPEQIAEGKKLVGEWKPKNGK